MFYIQTVTYCNCHPRVTPAHPLRTPALLRGMIQPFVCPPKVRLTVRCKFGQIYCSGEWSSDTRQGPAGHIKDRVRAMAVCPWLVWD